MVRYLVDCFLVNHFQPGDFRNHLPRWLSKNREQNSQIVNELKKFAQY